MNSALIRTKTKEAFEQKIAQEKSKGSMIIKKGCEKWHRLPYFIRVVKRP